MVVRATRNAPNGTMQMLHDGRHAEWAFERRFSLGEGVDRDKVTAHLENGLLHVTLPRRAEEKRRRIEVEVGERT